MASGCPDRRQPVHVQDGGGGPSRRRRRPRRAGMLTVLVVLGALALTGATASGPSPHLRLASTADPAPPGNVTITPADRALVVSWTAPAEAFISRYDVFLDANPVPVTSVASPTTTATLPGLANGRTY